MMRRLRLALLAVSMAGFGGAEPGAAALRLKEIPLLPPRPADLVRPSPPVEGLLLRVPAATTGDNDALRQELLASGTIIGKSLPALAGAGACGIAAPVELDAILLPSGQKVALVPPVVLRPALASAVARWVRDDLAPAAATAGDGLARIEGTGGYQCRDRDRVAGGILSEHATGDALDMGDFVTAKGKRYRIAAAADLDDAESDFLTRAKQTACARFMTVLGPGADSAHKEHLHVDLEARRSGAHLCEWDLPQKQPKTAAPAKPAAPIARMCCRH